jgi:ABC-type nitrate/sulfonate/bicarbonate transport system substrate-binding protein
VAKVSTSSGIGVTALLALALALATGAHAADTLRVGRSPGFLFAYTPLDVGLAQGFFQKRDLAIETVDFEGAAKMDQAIVAGSIDISLGSPMGMAMEVKGMPATAIAVIAGPMLEFGILVPYDSPVKSLDELKGKTFGIATIGSITQWVALELARVKGWGPDGIKLTAIGSSPGAAAAALKAHLVDATVGNATSGPILERAHDGRLLATAADFVPHFQAHTMYAAADPLHRNPDAVRRFLASWLEAVAFMRAHRDDTIRVAIPVTGLSPADETLEYDRLMPGISQDGRFDPQDMQRIGQSFVELHVLDREPDMTKLYTEQYLPPR